MLELEDIGLRNIGGRAGEPDLQWATLHAHFMDSETRHGATVEVKVAIPRRSTMTLEEIEAAGQGAAMLTMKSLLGLLENSSLSDVARDVEERDRLEREEHERRMANLASR